MYLEHIKLPEFLKRQENTGLVVIAPDLGYGLRLIDFYRIYLLRPDAESCKNAFLHYRVYDVALDVCRFIDENREAVEIAARDFGIVGMIESEMLAAEQTARAMPGKLYQDYKRRLGEKKDA